MTTENTIVKKILPSEGYLLTNGETITDCLFMSIDNNPDGWWEILNPNYQEELDTIAFEDIDNMYKN